MLDSARSRRGRYAFTSLRPARLRQMVHHGFTLDEGPPIPFGFAGRWIVVTAIGWLVGILCLLLIDVGAEAIGWPAQFGIGLGIGVGVGFFQWRLARRSFGASGWWMWWSGLGLACPFAICDLAGYGLSGSALIAAAALGGLIAGLGQARLLGVRVPKRYWWVAASLSGWAAASATTVTLAIPGRPASALQWVRQLLALAGGGIILAAVTGPILAWLLSVHQPPPKPS